ncbi:hypothetical protein BC834DRAFT_374388 [Gloeopeniophorella convolvens]|nr:hypothetical protein BC834DRAFT_374388 [Gloeopeniophorella convolvens]
MKPKRGDISQCSVWMRSPRLLPRSSRSFPLHTDCAALKRARNRCMLQSEARLRLRWGGALHASLSAPHRLARCGCRTLATGGRKVGQRAVGACPWVLELLGVPGMHSLPRLCGNHLPTANGRPCIAHTAHSLSGRSRVYVIVVGADDGGAVFGQAWVPQSPGTAGRCITRAPLAKPVPCETDMWR